MAAVIKLNTFADVSSWCVSIQIQTRFIMIYKLSILIKNKHQGVRDYQCRIQIKYLIIVLKSQLT